MISNVKSAVSHKREIARRRIDSATISRGTVAGPVCWSNSVIGSFMSPHDQ